MARGGSRPGAGRPKGSSVLDDIQKMAVANECRKRWDADCLERLNAAKEAVFGPSDYLKLASENRSGNKDNGKQWHSSPRAKDLVDDIEWAVKEMTVEPVGDLEPARRGFHFPVKNPYGIKCEIINEVSAWATDRYGMRVSVGIVKSAWDLQRLVYSDDD